MDKLYTRKGDSGMTKDFSGKEIQKDDLLMHISGKIDSMQSALDMSILLCVEEKHKEVLKGVQKKMWQVAGEIANCPGDCLIWPVVKKDLVELEVFIDSLGEPPNKFVRFENEKAIWYNECRVRCRDLERDLVKLLREGKLREEIFRYVNRLSSLFFMLGYKS